MILPITERPGLSATPNANASDRLTRPHILGAEPIQDFLATRAGMNGSHHPGLDPKRPVQDHGYRSQTVSLSSQLTRPHHISRVSGRVMAHGATSVRNNVLHSLIRLEIYRRVVHSKYHIQTILARSRDDDLLRAALLDVYACRVAGQHFSSRLHDVFDAGGRPVDAPGIALREQMDEAALVQERGRLGVVGGGSEHVGVVGRTELEVAGLGALAVCRVVADSREEVIDRVGGMVYGPDFEVVPGQGQTEDGTAFTVRDVLVVMSCGTYRYGRNR
jgi:hypothetical protein